jgi:hypothetical protein
MHDDGETPSQSHFRLTCSVPSRNLERPGSEPVIGSAAGHHDIGGFIEQRSDHGIAAFGDPPDLFDFARSMDPRGKAKDGGDNSRFVEAMSDIDTGAECDRH